MKKRPNIMQITTHDSGRHFGCYGHPTLHTPAIDNFASEGVMLTNYFAVAPICCASRATQLTGLYPQSHGLMDLCFPPFNWRIKDDIKHLSQILGEAGYNTFLFGIQHEVDGKELRRLNFKMVMATNGEDCVQIAENVTDFLKKSAKVESPFYLQIGFFETHTPFSFGGAQPDWEYGVEVPPYMEDDELSRNEMAAYQGSIRKVDVAVEKILFALRKSGIENNTIVVFTTDHGIEMPRAKWFLYDPGIEIGFVIRYPEEGIIGGRKCDFLLSNVDYTPTILDLAGIQWSGRFEGYSFAPILRGEQKTFPRNYVFAMYHKTHGRCIRNNRFSYMRYFDAYTDFARLPVRINEVMARRGAKLVELFDLKNDPNQFFNIVDKPEYSEIQNQMESELFRWMESVNDPLLEGPVCTPSYKTAISDYLKWKRKN